MRKYCSSTSACTNQTYGQDCKENCGYCLDDDTCDPVDGHCQTGCKAGFNFSNDPSCKTGTFVVGNFNNTTNLAGMYLCLFISTNDIKFTFVLYVLQPTFFRM